jgi:hypothetical protein
MCFDRFDICEAPTMDDYTVRILRINMLSRALAETMQQDSPRGELPPDLAAAFAGVCRSIVTLDLVSAKHLHRRV